MKSPEEVRQDCIELEEMFGCSSFESSFVHNTAKEAADTIGNLLAENAILKGGNNHA